MKKTVLISGAYGDGNLGDDFLLNILVKWIENLDNNCNIYITANNPSYVRLEYPSYTIVSKARAKSIQCDIEILGGGTQFFSFSSKKQKNRVLSYLLLALKNPQLLISYLKNRFFPRKTPTAIALGIGLGPFFSTEAEKKAKELLKSFNYVFCRDKRSFKYCTDWGVDSSLAADICFSDFFINEYGQKHIAGIFKSPKIGIVLRDWSHNERGELINQAILEWAKKNEKYNLQFYVFSAQKDKKLITQLTNKLPNIPLHIWDPDLTTYQQYLNRFNESDIVITSRYHAAIFSTSFEIPTICLDIDPKLFYLTEEVEGFHYWKPEEETSVLDLIIEEIVENYEDYQRRIGVSGRTLRDRSNQMYDEFKEILK